MDRRFKPFYAARLALMSSALLTLGGEARADHIPIAIDGNLADLEAAVVANQGILGGGFATDDALGDMYTPTCAYVNGYDLRRGLALFDSRTTDGQPSSHTTLYLGFQSEGVIGDVDGKGDLDAFTPGSPGQTSGCAVLAGELAGIGAKELYALLVDSDCDGANNFRLGITDNQLAVIGPGASCCFLMEVGAVECRFT